EDGDPCLPFTGGTVCGEITDNEGGHDADRQRRAERAEVEQYAGAERPGAEDEHEDGEGQRRRRDHRRECDQHEFNVSPAHHAPPVAPIKTRRRPPKWPLVVSIGGQYRASTGGCGSATTGEGPGNAWKPGSSGNRAHLGVPFACRRSERDHFVTT